MEIEADITNSDGVDKLILLVFASCRVKTTTKRDVKLFIITEASASWRIFLIL